MPQFRIANILGLMLIAISIPMPWFSFAGFFNASMLDRWGNYLGLQEQLEAVSQSEILSQGLAAGVNIFGTAIWATTVADVVCFAALILAASTIRFHKLSLSAGTLAILGPIFWIWGVHAMKSKLNDLFLQGMDSENMWTGAFGSLLTGGLSIGYGTYFALVGGFSLLIGYWLFTNPPTEKGETQATTAP
jgi:hypothetical protein